MKRQIRRRVFETNSSSVHSITMCSGDEFEKWENGEVLFWREQEKFATRSEIIEEMRTMKWSDGSPYYDDIDWDDDEAVEEFFFNEGIKTYDQFFDNERFEAYCEEYETKSGKKVIAFGY